jgi:hypothetical protein
MRLDLMQLDMSTTNVAYQFLPIVEWCNIGQEYYKIESNSTFVMLVTACQIWNHHPS